MSYMRGQQEYFALPNRHIVKITIVADLHHHVALQLVKEFLHRVVMIIGAFVWTADHHHGHFAVLEYLLVADRRLKQVCVLVDPLLKVERFKPSALHEGVLPSLQPEFPSSHKFGISASRLHQSRVRVMSATGTKRTSRHHRSMSAFGGKADIEVKGLYFRF